MAYADKVQKRIDRLMKWYFPSRVGIFYHYGLFTGGGNATIYENCEPLTYKSPEEFEAAADPEIVARNLVQNALDMGAKYLILTSIHSCGGLMMLYPTKLPEFRRKTKKDYIGAYLRAARAAGLYPMLYYPGDCHNHNAAETLGAVAPEITPDGCVEYFELSVRVLDEWKERYGDLIAGFWLDGVIPGHFEKIPSEIRKRFPDAVVTINGREEFSIPEQDIPNFAEKNRIRNTIVPEPIVNVFCIIVCLPRIAMKIFLHRTTGGIRGRIKWNRNTKMTGFSYCVR